MSLIRSSGQKILKWIKLFVPLSKLRFYPPQFIIRNPITQAVQNSFALGYEVAVMVFNIADLIELKENMDKQIYGSYIVLFKKSI